MRLETEAKVVVNHKPNCQKYFHISRAIKEKLLGSDQKSMTSKLNIILLMTLQVLLASCSSKFDLESMNAIAPLDDSEIVYSSKEAEEKYIQNRQPVNAGSARLKCAKCREDSDECRRLFTASKESLTPQEIGLIGEGPRCPNKLMTKGAIFTAKKTTETPDTVTYRLYCELDGSSTEIAGPGILLSEEKCDQKFKKCKENCEK